MRKLKSGRSLAERLIPLGITIITAGLVVILGLGGWQLFSKSSSVTQALPPQPRPTAIPTPVTPEIISTPLLAPSPKIIATPAPVVQAPPTPSLPAPPPVVPAVATAFGHFSYQEAPSASLVQIGMYYDRPEFLTEEAAAVFKQMQGAAQRQGVKLRIISGFRSVAAQEALFTQQIKRKGSVEQAARFSAPPGYSEHHTGYALDIGDGEQLQADIKYEFESTAAYRWLAKNAPNYGFELSFGRNNPQGVTFEPWHWRYVGSDRARYIFAASRGY